MVAAPPASARIAAMVASEDVPGSFAVGDAVQYLSDTTGQWVDAVVQHRYAHNGG
eukprot:CAMPEP_0180545640 /NCGR_PEP_ID=MMETSP1036_2-20121128/70147_1 /TAXON_ID=632150 /ORGANISM="Azadinium spinosum, Strain 3D9" /LENGTH=54 /DNA_ID=CAMNT_0022560695 /DNA_START=60 /DNA_END=221 /DNA_ORIENTATION=+